MTTIIAITRDISGLENINDLIFSSPFKFWIKPIPINKTIPLNEYNRKNLFIQVAEIIPDTELVIIGKKQGVKKRNTVIQFIPKISNEDYSELIEWIYLFVINGQIVKIGGTRTGIKKRAASYICGHHIIERGKSGDCSKTNGYIYNTFDFYLQNGCKIEMYGYKLPKTEITINAFGEGETKITAQTYNTYESMFINDFVKNYGFNPYLSDNSDPEYRT